MSEQTEEGINLNLLEGIPSQPDFVDSLDGPKLDNYLQGSFLSYPSSPQKQAYSAGIPTNIPYQQAYQQQLEQMNKQHQNQKAKTSPSADNVYSDLSTQIQPQPYPQPYQPQQQYQQAQSSYSPQQPQSYSQTQQSQSYSQPQPVQPFTQPSYTQPQQQQSSYTPQQPAYTQSSSQAYTQPQSTYSQPQQNTYQSTNYSSQPYGTTQSQQSLQNTPSQSQSYSSTSTSAYTQPQSSYVTQSSYQPQSAYQSQSSYSDTSAMSNTPRPIAPSQSYNNQGYSTSSQNNYYLNNNNSSGYSSGSSSHNYPSSSSSYPSSYGSNQYPNAAQLLAQNNSGSFGTNVNKQEGLKSVNYNQSRPKEHIPIAPARGKGLIQRVLDNPRQSGLVPNNRYNGQDSSFNEVAYWANNQGGGQTGMQYNSPPYNPSMMYQIPTNYSRNARSKPSNNNRMSGSSYQRNRNRYPRENFDSEDDEFIDNRNLNELSERSEDTFSDDGEVRESIITTRKRRRDNNLELFAEDGSDSSIHIIESDFGEETLRPVTRSRVGNSDRKQKRHHMLYDADDSEAEEEDDESVQDTQDDAQSVSDDDIDDEGDLIEKNNDNNQDVSPKKKISQLQKLITVCEAKVDKLTEILAQNGLEYEKLKQTAVSITLPLSIDQPALLSDHCKLTQYQLVGLNWLWLLNQANLNGILADEMGLGKTLQTIAMFALLKEKNICNGPHLVVVPSSTLTQWYNEIQHWCPTLKTITYHGNLNERKEIRSQCKNHEDFDILLTTYQLVGGKSDKKLFKTIPWHYLVLDEAQNIKNGSSLRFQTLFKIKSKNKLLLTGTPLQNNLQELWALLHFLMSDEFEKLKIENYSEVFRDFIKNNNEGTKQKKRMKVTEQDEYISKLKKILEPFLLRRLKREVSLDLSEKIHTKEVVTMTDTQQSLYTQIYMHSKSVWNEKQHQKQMMRGVVKDGNKSISLHNFLNNLLMQLRKVSNHPLLLRVYYDDSMIRQIAQILLNDDTSYKRDKIEDVIGELSMSSDWELHELCSNKKTTILQLEPFVLSDAQVFNISGKMNRLKEVLIHLKKENRRVLIFSQMTRMMNILSCLFDRESHSYVRLDGSTPVADRQVLIDKYNTDPSIFIFLLSTRAGGLGINLSTADTVIFYDIAFNPQVDRQAEDRCHRLGQTKQVNVITLLTKDSCEEQIWEMAHEKKELNDIMLQEGEYSKKFQDEGDYEIIEEKEEELGTDAAMQVFLTQIFSTGEEGQFQKQEEDEEEKKSSAKEKKEKKEKMPKEKVVKEKKEKTSKEPKSPKEPKPKKEKVQKEPKTPKEKKVKIPKTPTTPKEKRSPGRPKGTSPKTPKVQTEPKRKKGRPAKNHSPKNEVESLSEEAVSEGNLKRSQSHLFETIADVTNQQPKKKRKVAEATSLIFDSNVSSQRPLRKTRLSDTSHGKKDDDDFVFSVEDDTDSDGDEK